MFLSGLMIGFAFGGAIMFLGICLLAAALGAVRVDARDDTDEFTPSMQRFGYVQSARNRGDM